MILIAFDPFIGQYPSFSRANPARERTCTQRRQPSLVNSCSAAALSRSYLRLLETPSSPWGRL